MRKIKALLAVILALQLVGSALSFAETETVEEVEETATPSEQQIQELKSTDETCQYSAPEHITDGAIREEALLDTASDEMDSPITDEVLPEGKDPNLTKKIELKGTEQITIVSCDPEELPSQEQDNPQAEMYPRDETMEADNPDGGRSESEEQEEWSAESEGSSSAEKGDISGNLIADVLPSESEKVFVSEEHLDIDPEANEIKDEEISSDDPKKDENGIPQDPEANFEEPVNDASTPKPAEEASAEENEADSEEKFVSEDYSDENPDENEKKDAGISSDNTEKGANDALQDPEADIEEPVNNAAAKQPADEVPAEKDAKDSLLTTGWVPQPSEETGAAQGSTTDKNGNTTYGEITVSKVTVQEVETNSQYSRMIFDFSDEENGQKYRCFITGLEVSPSNTEESYNRLAYDIAFSFLYDQRFSLSTLTAGDKYSLTVDLIDAEKENILEGNDTNLCWAASAADLLEFTGWNKQEDEDAAYEEFRNSFNNLGGTQNMAIDWYMNGINPAQKVTEDGEVLYTNTSSGAAQQLAENTGGFWMDYASAAVAPDQGSYNNIEDLLTEGTQKLSEGYGLGVGVYSYKNAEAQGKGHSLGIFGFINEIISQSVEKLAALLVSDSDDTASGQTIGREERDNTYSLYKVGSYDNGNIQSIELVDYRSEPDLHTVIGTVTSVAPYMSAKGNEEKEGSADPRSDINLVPVELAVKDTDGNELSETTPAQTVQLDVETWNNSYARIPDKATAEIVVSVTRDGKPVKSIRKIVELNNLDPLKTMLSTMNYDLSESGTYDFKVSIGGIKDGEGNAIREAYTSDNALATGFTIVIPEKETPAEEKDDLRKELPTDSETPEDPAAEEAATEKDLPPAYEVKTDEKLPASVEWIWEAYVDLSDPETFVVSFRAPVKDKMDFSVLRYLKTKEVVDLDQYEILWKGDSLELSFSKDFLKKLLPGRNDFELLYSNGRVLIRLNVM